MNYKNRKFLLRNSFLILLALGITSRQAAENKTVLPKLKISEGKVLFRSEAPQEEIYGSGSSVSGEVDPQTGSVQIFIDIRDYKTGNHLRDAHMHENYLESDLFPKASFVGKISSYDPQSGKVAALGTFQFHGQQKENFKIEGILSPENRKFRLTSSFFILLEDYKIEIPKLLIFKLNNKVEVKTDFLLEPSE
ncbi:YceI family protein [Leptospira semungkisensis]|uniref:YceI family protein n=1 Tax=Leptospira semungkisensis TaxID=2484985 RepID=A0A4R9G4W5_9LEPT|nr:YceI family protein [Leptospira semungkisensis]TGK06576.1 YceI family protein [Leptospira semungkisensis]